MAQHKPRKMQHTNILIHACLLFRLRTRGGSPNGRIGRKIRGGGRGHKSRYGDSASALQITKRSGIENSRGCVWD